MCKDNVLTLGKETIEVNTKESRELTMGDKFEILEHLIFDVSHDVDKDGNFVKLQNKPQSVEHGEFFLEQMKAEYKKAYKDGESDGSYQVCDECGDIMIEGYCIESGDAYYCQQSCLEKHMTQEEYDELYDEGEGDSYWTDWSMTNYPFWKAEDDKAKSIAEHGYSQNDLVSKLMGKGYNFHAGGEFDKNLFLEIANDGHSYNEETEKWIEDKE